MSLLIQGAVITLCCCYLEINGGGGISKILAAALEKCRRVLLLFPLLGIQENEGLPGIVSGSLGSP